MVAEEAARLMLEEGISQYLDAKRRAAKTVLRGGWARPKDLPSNGEIRGCLLRRVELAEGPNRAARLFAMRATAVEVMESLVPYHPRLIGSVWSGHARRGSDIDLHVFPDDPDLLEHDLHDLGWCFEREEVLIRVSTGFHTYLHLHLLELRFPVELSVYPPQERTRTTRSSTDGKPIDRVSTSRLLDCIEREHPLDWERWRATGEVDWTEPPAPGPFDSLIG